MWVENSIWSSINSWIEVSTHNVTCYTSTHQEVQRRQEVGLGNKPQGPLTRDHLVPFGPIFQRGAITWEPCEHRNL